MANRGHPWIPTAQNTELGKAELLAILEHIDRDDAAKERVLKMETEFRKRIHGHLQSLPTHNAKFEKFGTNPFVLLFYASQQNIKRIHEMELAILPAKAFSSMETSAGKMLELVTFPLFGWEIVESGMHSANSALDGRKIDGDMLRLATLKSGPRCLNDEMSENLADAIIGNCVEWANHSGVNRIDFTYGVLYGTTRLSNKKDWHILRNLWDKLPHKSFAVTPEKRWTCTFNLKGVEVTATIRIGRDWWTHLTGADTALVELSTALIRSCIGLSEDQMEQAEYTILDLKEIISTTEVPDDFNVALLQRSQIEWLFFVARHFCDKLLPLS